MLQYTERIFGFWNCYWLIVWLIVNFIILIMCQLRNIIPDCAVDVKWCPCHLWCRHKCRTRKRTNSILKTNIQRMHCPKSCCLLLPRSSFASCQECCIDVSSDVKLCLMDSGHYVFTSSMQATVPTWTHLPTSPLNSCCCGTSDDPWAVSSIKK